MENTVREGEIACYRQFFLSLTIFSTAVLSLVHHNVALCGNGLHIANMGDGVFLDYSCIIFIMFIITDITSPAK